MPDVWRRETGGEPVGTFQPLILGPPPRPPPRWWSRGGGRNRLWSSPVASPSPCPRRTLVGRPRHDCRGNARCFRAGDPSGGPGILQPPHSGGGKSDDEEEPFAGFSELSKVEKSFIEKMTRNLDDLDLGSFLYEYIEEAMYTLLDPNRVRQIKECHGKVVAHVARDVGKKMAIRMEKAESECLELKKEKRRFLEQQKEDKRKIEELKNQIREKAKIDGRVEASTQTEEDNQLMDLENEEEGEGLVMRKLDEILRRVRVLEEKEKKGKVDNIETEDRTTWIKVIGRKKDQIRQERGDVEEERRNMNKKKETTYGRRKRNVTTLQAVKRRLPKGAGVLLELRGGTQQEYQEVLKSCQEKIKLEELGIPPIGLRKARGGGILLEVRCNDNEEEKARQLAERMKEVGTVEGAKVRCPLRRLRLRLTGLPFNAVASEIAEAVAELGGGGRAESVRGRMGPLRTSWSGAGAAWAVCPAEMAVRAAEAAELTLGWARVGVILERGGALPSVTAAWHVGA